MAKRGSMQVVHRAIRKYQQAEASILAIGPEQYIRDLERVTIAKLKLQDPDIGYNVADGGTISPVAGKGHTLISKQKMSHSQKQRVRTEEEIRQWAQNRKGAIFSEEHRQKLREAMHRRWGIKLEQKTFS